MARVGTLAWAWKTNGVLRRRDRIELYTQLARLQLRRFARRLPRAARDLASVDLDALAPPDSALAMEAEALCVELSPPFLVEHCRRTFVWARLFGEHDRIRHDPELLFVAAILHDLGLTGRYSAGAPCFTIRAASVVGELCRRHKGSPEAVNEAIVLHMNLDVPLRRGPEAHLLARGTACDVAGAGLRTIAASSRDAVLARHPRHGMKREILRAWRANAVRPGSRAELLSQLGLEQRILAAPFDS